MVVGSSDCHISPTRAYQRSSTPAASQRTGSNRFVSAGLMSYEVEKQVLTGHTSDVNTLDFSHSDVLVSGSNDKTLRVWIKGPDGAFVENVDHEPKSPLIGHKYGVNCVRFSPFDTIIASASTDGSIIMWSAKVL